MSKTINIGKNTLGSGGKMEVNLHNYDSSTSDKGYTFKTTGIVTGKQIGRASCRERVLRLV